MPVPWSLPENLARIRKARDLSQEQLAAAAGVAVDTVARIERGERQTTRPSTVNKLAAALGVSPAMLLGILPPVRGPDGVGVVELRQAITATEEIPGLADFTETAEVLPLEVLAGTAHRAWRAYVDGRHGELLHALPTLLVDARRLAHASSDDAKAAAHRVLSTAYRLGAGIAGRFGLDDLAWTSAERALHTARLSDAPDLETAVSLRYLVWTLVRQGRPDEAERVAVRAAERIEPRMLDKDPDRAGVFGNLLFNAASAALRAGRGERANDLLAVAHAAAVRAGRDRASEAAIFGPRVAALQVVDQTVRLGDPETALRLAERLPGSTGDVPAFWEAGHRLMLASAAAELRNDRLALGYLAQARDLAPDWVQYQPLGASTMRTLVDRAARRRGEDFAALAAHYGVIS
ncbi:MAG TPA: helix-turn-helix transcriptional regulator [Actinophytocola sp.]|uniref:helix-turn-helix domain-containing protein n=1 Tax=Actinophytocola sp. TaxID=1872138 RepID=UPI002DDD793C|nr:helix-turn-helix transcriptional regulator [Actinophytocola sp.]HEV2782363.1 helix-turn-helix transcriptional regulator [Actinophytocola sp.]